MARALAVPVRLALFRRWQRGQTAAESADAWALPARTVRHSLRRFRQRQRPDPLAPAYDRCGWPRPWPDPAVYQQPLGLRRLQPRWGAGLIRVVSRERGPQRGLPSTRTLRRWFARAGLGPAPRGREPVRQRHRATRAHDVWPMDAVEHVRLQHGQRACRLRMTDEFSGAVLHTKVFAVGRWSQVAAAAVQAELRQALARRGRPHRLRVDNGCPWGSEGDLPTCLALWSVGLDIAVVWNPPRQPRRNAVVGRSQGGSQQWAEPHTGARAAGLQRRLDRMDRLQRETYPSVAGRGRRASYPELAHSGRDSTPAWEQRRWRLDLVRQYRAEYAVPRRVDQKGEIWLYDRSYGVGKPRVGQVIYVPADPQTGEWGYYDHRGGVLRRNGSPDLTAAAIVGLHFGQARHRPPRGKRQRPQERQS